MPRTFSLADLVQRVHSRLRQWNPNLLLPSSVRVTSRGTSLPPLTFTQRPAYFNSLYSHEYDSVEYRRSLESYYPYPQAVEHQYTFTSLLRLFFAIQVQYPPLS
jgi:hypothetical protein